MATKSAPKRAKKKVTLNKPPANEGKRKRTPAKKSATKRTTAKKRTPAKKSATKKRTPAKKSATTKTAAKKATTAKKTVRKPAKKAATTSKKKAPAKKRAVKKPAVKTGADRVPKYLQDDGKMHNGNVIRYFCTHDDEFPEGYTSSIYVCSKKCLEIARDTLVETFKYKDKDLRVGNIKLYRKECHIHPLLELDDEEMEALLKGNDDE